MGHLNCVTPFWPYLFISLTFKFQAVCSVKNIGDNFQNKSLVLRGEMSTGGNDIWPLHLDIILSLKVQKDRAGRHDLKSRSLLFILLFFFPFFGRELKGEKNNQSFDFKSCLSARSFRNTFNFSYREGLQNWQIIRLFCRWGSLTKLLIFLL